MNVSFLTRPSHLEQGNIMALPLPTPPFLSRHHRTRRAPSSHCTHRNLTRLYNDHDCQRCTVCHRVPDFGYLYRCTQETNGNLPTSDFSYETIAMEVDNLRVDDQELSHRTHLLGSDCNTVSSSYRTASNSNTGTTVSTDAMDTDVIYTDMATDENQSRGCGGKRRFEIAFPTESVHVPANCDLKICHACRPFYKDRAWQSLNYVVNDDPIIPSEYEFNNRRVSDATTILNIDYQHVVAPENKKNDNGSQLAAEEAHHSTTDTRFSPHQGEIPHTSSQRIAVITNNIRSLHNQYNESASDADDEKDFGNDEDEYSGTTNSDIGSDKAEYSEGNDLLRSFHSYIPVPHPAFSKQPQTRDGCKVLDS